MQHNERASPKRADGSGDGISLDRALAKLTSLHDSDRGLGEIIACGRRAVPALRELLFARDPSGLFQTRCLAAKALAWLGAHDVLIAFLEASREIADPVERAGEDAVVNAAARALAGLPEPHLFELFVRLLAKGPLPGPIEALGRLGRDEAIPYLVAALAEDESRPSAEAALRSFGVRARQALLVAVAERSPSLDRDSVSRLRQRRSALGLLIEIGIEPGAWPVLRHLMSDVDRKIAVLACEMGLMVAPEREKRAAVFRLISLLADGDIFLAHEIEQILVTHYDRGSDLVAAALGALDPFTTNGARRVLLRVKARAEVFSGRADR